jgi:cytosine/adenosine deaminase-related metal-dependent hydrolase
VRARRLAARWLMPVGSPPLERGALLIGVDGRIQAVGREQDVPHSSDVPAEDYGDAVILPGLINTHTHLELTGFEDQVQEPEFPAWIRRLRELKTTRSPADYLGPARSGLAACYRSGVTTVADTGDSGAVIQALAEAGGSGVAYQEVFGPHPTQLEESLTGIRTRVSELRRWATSRVRVGVSPHSPYAVSGPLLTAVAEWARAEGLPLAVHIAESHAEVRFLAEGAGPFADAWRARGIPLPRAPGGTPIAWLAEHGALTEATLCIHAVQVGSADVERLAETGAAVAHCPLSNRAHAHGTAPLAAMLEAGIRVGLGTDSVVSVGRLDLLAEARAARSLAPLTADDLVELCTLGGARALGLESEIGALRVGLWGDCTVIRLPAGRAADASPAEQVLASSPAQVLLTCVGGREVYRQP